MDIDGYTFHAAPPVGIRPVRAARFQIPWHVICNEPELARLILENCIPVRAERLAVYEGIEYIALGDHFPEVRMGEVETLIPTIIVHSPEQLAAGSPRWSVQWPNN